MPKICVVVGFPFDEEALRRRRRQIDGLNIGPEYEFEYRAVKVGPTGYDNYHDFMLADIAVFEAGIAAAREGFDAICVDSLSDSGVKALRSVLDIPVVGPGKLSLLTALMLGDRFSIVTISEVLIPGLRKIVEGYGLAPFCASIRSIPDLPDPRNLLDGKEEVLPRFLAQARECVRDGAEVICLGSTTMHAAHAYLAGRLAVPVIDPGPLSYKLAQLMIETGLTHSKLTYKSPANPMLDIVAEMLQAGAKAAEATP